MRWLERLCMWLSAMPALQKQIVWLFRGRGFSSSALLQFLCVFKTKQLFEVVFLENDENTIVDPPCHTSVQLQFCHVIHGCRYELSAHLHAEKSEIQDFLGNSWKIWPSHKNVLSYDKQNFVFLLACSPNKGYLYSWADFYIIHQNIKPLFVQLCGSMKL